MWQRNEEGFSLLKAVIHDQQDQALQDYFEASVMLRHDYRCCLIAPAL